MKIKRLGKEDLISLPQLIRSPSVLSYAADLKQSIEQIPNSSDKDK
jgi:hypothetical protein